VYGGTGLGLSITSKLVNRLGGIISLESEFGKFAEFIVDLPFKGEPVNTEKLKKRLTDVFIVVVQPTIRYDYSFTSFPIDQEPSPFGHRVVDQYGLDVSSFESLPDLIGKLQEGKSIKVGKHFAILVDENLYNENQLVHIAEQIGPRNCTLMTFGPNYEIEATKQRHFRSLLGVFPSILLDSIANHVTRTKQEVFNSAIDLCSPNGSRATSKGIFEAFDEVTDGMSVAVNDGLRKMADPQREAKAVATDASANAVDEKPRSRPQPSSKGTNITKKSENNKPTPPDRNLKVLLAEDNKINQKVMSRVLTRVGIKDITVVDDGLKAVNISEKEKFDIIFMDMQMPVMDGMEATNIIVARDKDAKIIFVTAHALDEFKHKADAAGAVSFISKPFQVQDIERVLSELGYD
jgi:CheY-like chemotaxis protein